MAGLFVREAEHYESQCVFETGIEKQKWIACNTSPIVFKQEGCQMKKIRTGLLILVVFLVGCAVATVASDLVIPPLNAQNTNVTRWDYHCDIIREGNMFRAGAEMTKKLKSFGAEGWELVSVESYSPSGGTLGCFKRPL